MAKTNKSGKTAKAKNNGTITLDFTEAYNKYQEYLDTPCEGTMQIPEDVKKEVKLSYWQRFKNWFKKK